MIILKIIGFIAAFFVVGFIVLWFKYYLIPIVKHKYSIFKEGVALIKMAKRKSNPELKRTLRAVGKGMIKIALGL